VVLATHHLPVKEPRSRQLQITSPQSLPTAKIKINLKLASLTTHTLSSSTKRIRFRRADLLKGSVEHEITARYLQIRHETSLCGVAFWRLVTQIDGFDRRWHDVIVGRRPRSPSWPAQGESAGASEAGNGAEAEERRTMTATGALIFMTLHPGERRTNQLHRRRSFLQPDYTMNKQR
jgi:hypothetical protein